MVPAGFCGCGTIYSPPQGGQKEGLRDMIYVTGDTHGQIERFKEKPVSALKKGDTLIVLGDFGFLWDGSKAEQRNLHWLGKRRYNILFIDGCHENFDLLGRYPVEEFLGGMARHIDGNLWYVQRGSVLTIEGKRLLCFGGGESDDIEDREEGVNWWPAEMPTPEEIDRCRAGLYAADGGTVDYVLTHEAPGQVLDFLNLRGLRHNWLHTFLDEVFEKTTHKQWLFGRYHRNQLIGTRVRAVFSDLVPLE